MACTTFIRFGFHKPECWERGFVRQDHSLRAVLDVRFGTFTIKSLTGLIERRHLTEEQALERLAEGQNFTIIDCPFGD